MHLNMTSQVKRRIPSVDEAWLDGDAVVTMRSGRDYKKVPLERLYRHFDQHMFDGAGI